MTKAKHKSRLKWQFTWSSGRSIMLLIGCSSVEPVQDVEVAMIQSSSTPLQSNRPKHRLSSFSPSISLFVVDGFWECCSLVLFWSRTVSAVAPPEHQHKARVGGQTRPSPQLHQTNVTAAQLHTYLHTQPHTHSAQKNFTTTPSHSYPSFSIPTQAYFYIYREKHKKSNVYMI